MASPIENYAVIGDGRTAALVSKDGSIDWLCLPDFDASACFAALLGSPENGRWRIAPHGRTLRASHRYVPDTLILETEFETRSGRCRLTDFMPVETPQVELVRIVEGLEGEVELDMDLTIRFDYGRRVPWVTRSGEATVAIAGPDLLVLRSPAGCHGEGLKTVCRVTIRAGERIPFVLTHGASHLELPQPTDIDEALASTREFWTGWSGRCSYDGPWRDAVVRSLLTLKALIYRPTGGIIASPTTSLPEHPGGQRNWDYRYCWLRDATFTLMSLMQVGYRDDAEAWRGWLVRAAAGHPSQLQPIYTITGVQRIDEREVPWLSGYRELSPGAHRQPGGRATPARFLWRGTGCAASGAPIQPHSERRELVPAADDARAPRDNTRQARPRDLGGSGHSPALHPFPRHDLGRFRSGRRRHRGLRSRRSPGPLA